jgi:hypothetical protein
MRPSPPRPLVPRGSVGAAPAARAPWPAAPAAPSPHMLKHIPLGVPPLLPQDVPPLSTCAGRAPCAAAVACSPCACVPRSRLLPFAQLQVTFCSVSLPPPHLSQDEPPTARGRTLAVPGGEEPTRLAEAGACEPPPSPPRGCRARRARRRAHRSKSERASVFVRYAFQPLVSACPSRPSERHSRRPRGG